jgi:lysozyme
MAYTLGKKGIELIKQFEGLCLNAYKDSVNIWTIGYGSTRINGKPVVQGQSITLDEANAALIADTSDAARFLGQSVVVPLTQNQVDALICFCYNVGVGAFQNSTLRKTINAKGTVTEKMFTDWNKIRDPRDTNRLVPLEGLTRRRKAEYALFITQETV